MTHESPSTKAAEDKVTPPPRIETPLSTTWRDWIDRCAPAKENDKAKPVVHFEPPFDVAVVGSGYGGSVAALRLAQKGYRVLVLERGSEYLPGDFPNHFSQLTNYFRANIPTRPMPVGRASGLFEFSVGQGIVGVTGNGLGGGSLINAGVVLKPDPEVFAQEAWPAALRTGQPADPTSSASLTLEQAFAKAHAELGAKPFTVPGNVQLAKTKRFAETLNPSMRHGRPGSLGAVSLTIRSGQCVQCGDCASGCNTPEAKGDLRSTYLARAVATGRVQIVTQAQVYRFAPDDIGDDQQAFRWMLWVFSTEAQHHKTSPEEAGHEVDAKRDPMSTLRVLHIPALIISAGTLGSTQLLQRSQAQQGSKLAFSAALGTRLSGNGDMLSAMVNTGADPVNAKGWGSVAPRGPTPPSVGPTITTLWDGRAEGVPLTERIVLQDGAVPGALGRVFEEMIAAGRVMQQMDGWSCGHPLVGEDRLAASDALARHAQIWLSMGHDGAPGRILWMPGSDASAMVMPSPEKLATYQAQQRLFDQLGASGLHLHTPLWQLLPEATTRLMTGDKPSPTVTSVHLLGGCPMGDNPDSSVVDHLGRVWIRDPSHPERAWATKNDAANRQRLPNEPKVYPGLTVLDGAVVATSLGCNPLWTITALAERAISAWPCALNPVRRAAPAVRSVPRRVAAPQLHPIHWDMTLREQLQTTASAKGPWGGGSVHPLSLSVTFRSDDFEQMLRAKDHPIKMAEVTLRLSDGTTYGRPAGDPPPVFHFLPDPGWRSHGHWPLVWSILELLAIVAIPSAIAAAVSAGAPGLPTWVDALVVGLTTLATAVTLPFWRTFITWLEGGGAKDVCGLFHAPKEGQRTQLSWVKQLLLGFRQMVHAREKRVMRYDLKLFRQPGGIEQHPPSIHLRGTKRVVYRATWSEVWCWLGRRLLRFFSGRSARGPMPRLRPTFWERVMDADTTICKGTSRLGRVLFKGTLTMGLDQFLTPATAQLGAKGDTTTGLLTLSGYATLALRFAALTHVTDFRAPTYSGIPVLDDASSDDTAIRGTTGGLVHPTLHWVTVPRGASYSDQGHESTRDLNLRLWQYLKPDDELEHHEQCDAQRVKAVLLLHAFGQSGLTYTFKDKSVVGHQNLAEHLYQQGFEVWVLDSRMSTRSGYAQLPCSVDMMAEYDVPEAVDAIIALYQQRLSMKEKPSLPIQIAMFGQCIGSASAWMAILMGKLSQTTCSKLYAYASSQVHPIMKGASGTQKKTGVPLLLRHLLPYVPFAVRETPKSVVWQFMDRLFNSFPAPDEERKDRGQGDALATCRRIRFVEAPLFLHQNMSEGTIREMPRLFGDANLRLFSHARRFVEPALQFLGEGRLVDEDGFDRYVTRANARRHIRFPVLLLHGKKNELFDPRSAAASRAWLLAQGVWAVGSKLTEIPGYGHLDVLLGQHANQDVFPKISKFLESAFAQRECSTTPTQGSYPPSWQRVRALHGPVLTGVSQFKDKTVVQASLLLAANRLDPKDANSLHLTVIQSANNNSAPIEIFGSNIEPVSLNFPADASHSPSDANSSFDFAFHVQLEIPVNCKNGCTIEIHAFLPTHEQSGHTREAMNEIESTLLKEELAHPEERKHSTLTVSANTVNALKKEATSVDFWAACCRYPGWTIDAERIDHMAAVALKPNDDPAMAFLVGDQIYADATAGMLDPSSPIERYFERHLTAFNSSTMSEWLRRIPTVMTPDDHEWTDNYPHASPLLKWPWPDWNPSRQYFIRQRIAFNFASRALNVFQKSAWGHQRTHYTPTPTGPVSAFVFDTRYSRKRDKKEIVRADILNQLRLWLAKLPATQIPVIVSGSVVLPGLCPDGDPSHPGAPDTWQYAPTQRVELLDTLCTFGRPFVLLSGDYHISGTFAIEVNGRTVGAAIVAPPLYAPLPYANTRPIQVHNQETIALPTSGHLSLAPVSGGEPLSGSGWGHVQVNRTNDGCFTLTVTRTLMPLGEESPADNAAFSIRAQVLLR